MSSNCQVDFYLLKSTSQDAGKLACKLAMMAWERGHEITIVTADPGAAAALDELMWEYPENRFLPHEVADVGETVKSPVRIMAGPLTGKAEVVINLTAEPLPEPGEFKRLLEIVPHLPGERQASREKFKAYRALGLQPATHKL